MLQFFGKYVFHAIICETYGNVMEFCNTKQNKSN